MEATPGMHRHISEESNPSATDGHTARATERKVDVSGLSRNREYQQILGWAGVSRFVARQHP